MSHSYHNQRYLARFWSRVLPLHPFSFNKSTIKFVIVTNIYLDLSKHLILKMEYNQETIDKIRELMPLCMRKKVHENINKGVSEKAQIPYSTVCDVLQTYREGGRPRYRNRRLKVYDECVKLLAEKGIEV